MQTVERKSMMKRSWVGVFAVIACLAAACGGYGNVAPGMTAAEVSKEMNGYGVSRIVPFGGGYSATYYGNDTCVLFKDEKVVGKDEATEQRQAIGLGNVGVATVTLCHALCLPPGVAGQRTCESSGGVFRR
jgi:hypothetical protein